MVLFIGLLLCDSSLAVTYTLTADLHSAHLVYKARFPFKRNRLRCVHCINENRKKRKRLRWQAANHGCSEHSYWLALAFVA